MDIAGSRIHGLTNLTNLMGYYALMAFKANTFNIDLPAERTGNGRASWKSCNFW